MSLQSNSHRRVQATWRRFSWIFVVFLVIAACCVCAFFLYTFCTLKTVRCVADGQNPCSQDVQAEFERYRGTSLFSLPIPKIQEKVKKSVPNIRDIWIQKSFPSMVVVNIEIYPSALFLASPSSVFFYELSERGVVIDVRKERPSGCLYVVDELPLFSVGMQMQEGVFQDLLAVSRAMHNSDIRADRVVYTNQDEMTLFLDGNRTAIVRKQDVEKQLSTLQRILNEATMSEQAGIIDLRFSHPVFRK